MRQGYSIRHLPVDAIVAENTADYEYDSVSRKFIQNLKKAPMKIKGETFPDIPVKLPIRNRAVTFAKRKSETDIYAVLYADEKSIHCLFFFTCSDIAVLEMVRCMGKTAVKRHWQIVRDYITCHTDEIFWLSNEDSIEFSVDKEYGGYKWRIRPVK